jgi:aldehyde:ferredoxin oxidoreductase
MSTAPSCGAHAVRIVLAKRLFNLREGWTRTRTGCRTRFLAETLELESGRSATLTPERLRGMIDAYYEGRGLDDDGLPDTDQLEALGLHVLAP